VHSAFHGKDVRMLHHLSLGVRDLAAAGAFYDAALGALGYRRVFEDDTAIGYGLVDDEDMLCLKLRDVAAAPGPGFHLAFSAPTRSAVQDFHRAALQAGGHDNGPAGLRPDYGDRYYAAFVIDPDGHRIEAVTKQVQP
jgi:catechol 2,3-dioxygenase-like lactoylglutathione lyase family enzyme